MHYSLEFQSAIALMNNDFEEYERIDHAFYREKQVQGWNRKKKEALINGMPQKLHELAECMNETHYKNYSNGGFGSAQPPQSPRSLSEVEGSVSRQLNT